MRVRPVFIFGIARSGTNLVARMLDAHPAVEIALDPLLPLFRAFRNAVVRDHADAALHDRFDPESPVHDYYQQIDAPALLDLMLDADLEIAIPAADTAPLRESIVARAALESPDHADRLSRLSGRTFGEIFADAIRQIAGADGNTLVYAGVKEVWTIEFIGPLARTFPDARFIVIERDPRDVILSLQKLAASDKSQAAHSVSYMRHWRKNAVLARHFGRDSAIASRLSLVRFEELASAPEQQARSLCRFLDLDYDPRMIRLEDTVDPSTGQRWRGNSSFEDGAARITTRPVARWRNQSDNGAHAAVEFICGPEMGLAGYAGTARTEPDTSVLDQVLQAHRTPGRWRSDSGDPLADYGFELFRRRLLDMGSGEAPEDVVRRCFLFRWAFEALRSRDRTETTPQRTGS